MCWWQPVGSVWASERALGNLPPPPSLPLEPSIGLDLSIQSLNLFFYSPVTIHMVAYFTAQTATNGVLCTPTCCIQANPLVQTLVHSWTSSGPPFSINVSTMWSASQGFLWAFFCLSFCIYVTLWPLALPVWALFPLDGISRLFFFIYIFLLLSISPPCYIFIKSICMGRGLWFVLSVWAAWYGNHITISLNGIICPLQTITVINVSINMHIPHFSHEENIGHCPP